MDHSPGDRRLRGLPVLGDRGDDRRLASTTAPPTCTNARPGSRARERDLGTGTLTIERIHLVTSLPPGAASGSELAAWVRGHRRIENRLHHVRDHTFHEDASHIRTRHLRVMAGLRKLAIGIHRQDSHTDIAAALRHTTRDHQRPLTAPGPT